MAQPLEKMDQRAREVGRHQSLFREVNERIEELAETFDLKDPPGSNHSLRLVQ